MAENRLVNQAVDLVEDLCAPGKMTPAQAIDFLENVIVRLESSIEALQEENPEEG